MMRARAAWNAVEDGAGAGVVGWEATSLRVGAIAHAATMPWSGRLEPPSVVGGTGAKAGQAWKVDGVARARVQEPCNDEP